MENIRTALFGTLLVSAATGAGIALTDQYLWSTAPSHAIGLVAFVTIDIALAILLSRKTWLGSMLSIGLATVQAIAMTADILTYSTPDVTQQAFRTYLLSNPLFVILLVIQPVILGLAFGTANLVNQYYLVRRWIRVNVLA